MNLEIGKKQYIIYSIIFLLIAFCVALLQNYIRYAVHEGYRISSSITYLVVSLLLFALFLPLFYKLTELGLRKYRKYFVLFMLTIATVSILSYYIISSTIIYSVGFYDNILSEQYARQYFGREAFIHLLMVGATGLIFYLKPSKQQEKRISASVGRKEITIFTKDIQWIETYDHYLKIHTENESLLKRSTLEDMAKELKPDFIRIHRKYLVNRKRIAKKERQNRDEYVILNSGDRLKVGRSYSPLEW